MDTKYRYEFCLKPVCEFVRHDAEIAIDIDGFRYQKVIKAKCTSNDEADRLGHEFCHKLAEKISALIHSETDHLKTAQE